MVTPIGTVTAAGPGGQPHLERSACRRGRSQLDLHQFLHHHPDRWSKTRSRCRPSDPGFAQSMGSSKPLLEKLPNGNLSTATRDMPVDGHQVGQLLNSMTVKLRYDEMNLVIRNQVSP